MIVGAHIGCLFFIVKSDSYSGCSRVFYRIVGVIVKHVYDVT